MTMLNMGAVAADRPAREDAAAMRGCRSPMPQQAAFASYGYDFYPQTFVRLVGCHQSRTPPREAT
jgi:hypothetical protein